MLRVLTAFCLTMLAGVFCRSSWGQAYPVRPIRMLIPQPPGGTSN